MSAFLFLFFSFSGSFLFSLFFSFSFSFFFFSSFYSYSTSSSSLQKIGWRFCQLPVWGAQPRKAPANVKAIVKGLLPFESSCRRIPGKCSIKDCTEVAKVKGPYEFEFQATGFQPNNLKVVQNLLTNIVLKYTFLTFFAGRLCCC